MDRWEYLSVIVQSTELESVLLPFGEDGWEAVGFAPERQDYTSGRRDIASEGAAFSVTAYRVLLKRRLSGISHA